MLGPTGSRLRHVRWTEPVVLFLIVAAVTWTDILRGQSSGGFATIWLANGIVVAVLLCRPGRLWPADLACSCAGQLVAAFVAGVPAGLALPSVLANCCEILIAAGLLRPVVTRSADLAGTGPFVCFMLIAGVLAPVAAGAMEAAWLQLSDGGTSFHAALLRVLLWFNAHSLGYIVATPLVVRLLRGDLGEMFRRGAWRGTLAFLAGAVAVTLGVFLQSRYPLLFLIPPAVFLVATQVGFAGIALFMPILAGIALVCTGMGLGPFTLDPAVGADERRLLLQAFVAATLLLGRVAANVAAARARTLGELIAERQRLVDSGATLRLLTDHTSDIVTRVGPDGRWRYVSPAAERLFGKPPEALLGSCTLDFVHPDDRPGMIERIEKLKDGRSEEHRPAFRIIRPDGGVAWVEASTQVLFDPASGAPDGYVSVLRDITGRVRLEAEREAAEARERAQAAETNAQLERLARHLARARDTAEQASQAKSRFLTGVTHELRTPLNGILGYAQLLRLEGGLTPEQDGRVATMLAAGEHLLGMINSVLDLSQIESDRMDLRPVELDLPGLAGACLDVVRPVAEAKGLALGLATAPDVPSRLVADPTRLRQVLVNLLGNAVKFTAAGRVELRLVPGPAEAGLAGRVRLEVADTGPGIAAEHRDRVFGEFERVTDATTAVEGSGLGLAITARLVQRMGGSIGHADNPGGGSVFWIELPADRVAPAPAGEAPAAGARTCLRVLLVDDVAMNRDIAGSFLRHGGHDVVSVESGEAAIEAAASTDFDVVLMDVRMPGMDGLEATRRIRALGGARGGVPIVALTAQAFTDQLEACRRAGMDGHLSKPFTQPDLLSAVLRASEGRASAARREPAALRADVAPDATPNAASHAIGAPAPVFGADLPLLEEAVFNQAAAVLSPDAVISCLRTLDGRAASLLRQLRAPDDAAAAAVSQVAHALAGSAGMFGFQRLAVTARHFEHAADTQGPELAELTASLTTTIEASIVEMHRRMELSAQVAA